jgi:hypothetical protein
MWCIKSPPVVYQTTSRGESLPPLAYQAASWSVSNYILGYIKPPSEVYQIDHLQGFRKSFFANKMVDAALHNPYYNTFYWNVW